RGKNPLLLAAKAIAAIERMELPRDAKLGAAIMVPTDIVSNPHPSISLIPESVLVRYDRRIVTGETARSVLERLRGKLAEIDPEAFEIGISRGPVTTYTGKSVEAERYLACWLSEIDTPLANAAAASLKESGCEVCYGVYSF